MAPDGSRRATCLITSHHRLGKPRGIQKSLPHTRHRRAARADDHGPVRTGAVCGPSQRTKRRATTRRDTNQRRVFPLAGAVVGAVIRKPNWSPGRCCQSAGPCPRRAGRSPRWPATSIAAAGSGWAGCGISSTSPRATTRQPGGRARRRTHRFVEGCPRAAVWSGCARSTRCHTAPACKIIGDSAVR
jgi:hypothetical protein